MARGFLTPKEAAVLREFKEMLHEKLPKDVVTVTLFGSKARGKTTRKSDIDILVVTHKSDDYETMRKVEEVATEILLQKGVYISIKVLTQRRLAKWRSQHSPLIENIDAQGIPL